MLGKKKKKTAFPWRLWQTKVPHSQPIGNRAKPQKRAIVPDRHVSGTASLQAVPWREAAPDTHGPPRAGSASLETSAVAATAVPTRAECAASPRPADEDA